jgi:tetratricopeptide (TPR) repeat protein
MKLTPFSQNHQKKKPKITLQENLVNLSLPNDQDLNEIWEDAQKLYAENNFKAALQKLQPIIPFIDSEKYYPFLNFAGLISLRIDDDENALNYFNNSLNLFDSQSDIHYNLSIIYEKKLMYKEALDHLDKAIEIDPSEKDFLFNKANILETIGLLKEAKEVLKKLIKMEYTPDVLNLFGLVMQGLNEYKKSINYFQEALKLEKDNIKVLNNLSVVWRKFGDHDKSHLYLEEALMHAIEKNEYLALTYNNYGVYFEDLENFDKAISYFEKSQHIEKNSSNKMNLGVSQLKSHCFEKGWSNYEGRWDILSFKKKMINTKKNLWNGEIANSILVWGEQGIGDEILYSSMLQDTLKFCNKLYYACLSKKIFGLMKNSFENINILEMDEITNDDFFDYHIPVGNLGKFLRKNLSDFPEYNKFLYSDSQRKIEIQSKLQKKTIGISWRSNASDKKSIELKNFNSLITEKFDLVNIQYQTTRKEEKILNDMNVLDLGYDLYNDIDNLSALIDCCDYIVTTSNINAHIAGALGKKTFLLSSRGVKRFHYWISPTNKSLWYPSVEIVNQKNENNWKDEFQYIKSQIDV